MYAGECPGLFQAIFWKGHTMPKLSSYRILRAKTLFALMICAASIARGDELNDKVEALLELCIATGETQKIEGSLDASGKIRLSGPALEAEGDLLFTRQEWSGLIGGISSGMTKLQAEQATQVRDCLEPARAAIFQQIISN